MASHPQQASALQVKRLSLGWEDAFTRRYCSYFAELKVMTATQSLSPCGSELMDKEGVTKLTGKLGLHFQEKIKLPLCNKAKKLYA